MPELPDLLYILSRLKERLVGREVGAERVGHGGLDPAVADVQQQRQLTPLRLTSPPVSAATPCSMPSWPMVSGCWATRWAS